MDGWVLLLILLVVALVAIGVSVFAKRRRSGGVVAVERPADPGTGPR